MRPDAQDWFTRRTSTASDWPLASLIEAKDGRTIDVILPALNEASTIGAIVRTVRQLMAGGSEVDSGTPLIDGVVVVDGDSSDETAAEATAAGATVINTSDVLADLSVQPGKGESMWRGLAATTGDIVVFVDADLRSFTTDYLTGLLGPLLTDDGVHLVKAVYDRPLVTSEVRIAAGGGRVTELLARPLINALWPGLAAVAQPLSGEYAARRSLLELLSFPCGYGVEVGILVDTFRTVGLDGIAQVDLGEREHRHQDATQLSRMSAQILHAALIRADQQQLVYQPPVEPSLASFSHDGEVLEISEHKIQTLERPPLLSVPSYLQSQV